MSWNDLLRYRRVCKHLKAITEEFMRLNIEMAPEIEISETNIEKNLEAFISLNIPTAKLYLNNPTGHQYFDNLNTNTLQKFVETFGPLVKSLRMEQLSLLPCFNEWKFLDSLTSLKTLEASFLGYGVLGRVEERPTLSRRMLLRAQSDTRFDGVLYFPPKFNKTLEVIKIGNQDSIGYKIGNIHTRVPNILCMCEKLNYISFSVSILSYDKVELYYPPGKQLYDAQAVLVLMFMEFIRSVAGNTGQNRLKCIDFENYHAIESFQTHLAHTRASPYFLVLCEKSIKSGVKLLNVQSIWLMERENQTDPSLKSADLGVPIISLVNLDPCVFPLNMPNLEKIDIRCLALTNVSENDLPCRFPRPSWPALKILNIKVDLPRGKVMRSEEFTMLFDFFFKNIVRHELTELGLNFETVRKDACPNTEDIARACPNLKKMNISNWPGTNKALTKLWRVLQGLEEVTLENCSGLGNVAFVGEDVEDPVFLKLKNLKKLTLKGLDQMPKITDTLFSLVLARMKLTHLILTSGKPLKKITKAGILALLKGNEFGESIEKFPFEEWSLADMSDKEFKILGKLFKSFRMI